MAELQLILLLCGAGDIQVGVKGKENLEWGLNAEGKMAWLTPSMKTQAKRFEGVMLNRGQKENVVDEGRNWGMWNRRVLSTTVAGDLAVANATSDIKETSRSYVINSFGVAVNVPSGVGDANSGARVNYPTKFS